MRVAHEAERDVEEPGQARQMSCEQRLNTVFVGLSNVAPIPENAAHLGNPKDISLSGVMTWEEPSIMMAKAGSLALLGQNTEIWPTGVLAFGELRRVQANAAGNYEGRRLCICDCVRFKDDPNQRGVPQYGLIAAITANARKDIFLHVYSWETRKITVGVAVCSCVESPVFHGEEEGHLLL